MGLEQVRVTRYVTPLREGGSLPGIVEAEDLGTYVCKFRGAGQGLRVLVAEVIVAGLARLLDIPTPDQVVLDLDPEIARYEADEEVQDLLNASAGLNLGIDFLPGSFGYDPTTEPDADLAGRVLWLDAFAANVDRSLAQPEPARVARHPAGDRPRCVALLPPLLARRTGRPGALRPAAVRRERARAAFLRRPGPCPGRGAWPRGSTTQR
ncbi:HipA family kinase [Nocardioides convexus]|uniref:HipA family kinase n=1 Tax=Nocardioides convexus TaxID=2712224 RepID=UPI0024186216|nr:HipA family kinase [Nocardioides convexus]